MENSISNSSDSASPGPSLSRRDVFIIAAIFLLSLLVYNANMRVIGATDTYPARYIPFSIVRHHTLFMESVADVALQGNSSPYYLFQNEMGRTISFYPVVTPIIVSPLYIPAVAWLDKAGWTKQRLDYVARLMEKVAASLLASISACLMYLLLRRRLEISTALLLTIAYAFGTNTWVIGSQALWQHGTAELLLVGCLLLITRPFTAARGYAVGVLSVLVAFTRPPDALFAAAFMFYGFWWAGRRMPWMIAGALAAFIPLATYNVIAAGSLAGAYATAADRPFFMHSILPGIAGLLVSPGRGLFVFTPFLLFLLFGAKHLWNEFRRHPLAIALCLGMLLQILIYSKVDWRAGWSWGPRYLTDMVPILIWMLVPVVASLSRISRAVFITLVGVSIAIQTVGAFWYNNRSDVRIFAIVSGPDTWKAVWDVRNTPFFFELQHPPAARDLLFGNISGNIDRISIGNHEVTETPPGPEITVEGWALAGDAAPAAVNVMLLPADGVKWTAPNHTFEYPQGRTDALFMRPDVNATLHTSVPTGWRVTLWTGRLAPGDYQLEVCIVGPQGGEFRPVMQKPFQILHPRGAVSGVDEQLKAAATLAATRIREHQHSRGYWLTSHTKSTSFEHPELEMNTFLTSMLVDVLGPVAADSGLGETLDRARRHLADQIEDDGLVRYHGRPDQLEPGLGAKITPDADDTALAWRIAGGDQQRLPGVLRTLESYRESNGLYRTWLAPREQYVSIDPGKDPNPADIVIQMHVIMFLAKIDLSAAHHFYEHVLRGIADERFWVYYQVTPLIPLLREPDLAAGKFFLAVPENHLHTSIPGQEPWVGLCQLLAKHLSHESHPLDPAWKVTLLTSLAKDDFAALRRKPPLLYHNDLSATVPRFYWSEDFGYALWLRLYFETIHASPSAER